MIMAITSQNHMIVNIHTNIHGHFSGKNQNLTKSYDKGHAHKLASTWIQETRNI